MPKIYYVDTENVGDVWTELLDKPDSHLILFFTGHSPRIAYPQAMQLTNASSKPEFIECYEGTNGLDFQLVSYLGYNLQKDSSNEMIIVSNDTGFDAVVHFWTERGMHVSRIPSSSIPDLQPATTTEPVSDSDGITPTESGNVPETINGVSLTELYTIINCCPSVNDSSSLHLILVHLYGATDGGIIYKALKSRNITPPDVPWKSSTKIKKLLQLALLHCNTSNIEVPDSFIKFIVKNVTDDKKEMLRIIKDSYGDTGVRLNKLLKPFYTVLSSIKNQ